MPKVLRHANQPEYRDEAVCKFLANFTVRNSIFSEGRFWSILVTFRYFSIVDTRGSVQNRSELFAAKIRGPVGVERPVHMCANRQYLSHAGGTLGTDLDIQEVVNSSPALKRERKAHCNKANEPEADIDEFYITVFFAVQWPKFFNNV